jgi:hypothetical protein
MGRLIGMLNQRQPDDPRLARVSLRKELLAEGMNDKAITRLVAESVLHKVRYGAYVDATSWGACDEVGRYGLVVRAAVKQARAEVVVSHISALAEWDVPVWDLSLDEVHLTRVDQKAGRREAGVRQHLGALRAGDVVDLNRLRITGATRTALDSLTVLDVEHGITTVNDFLHRELTTADELAECREFMEQWPRSLTQDLVLRLADGRCGGSVGEGRTLYLLWRQGLPKPEPQYRIPDGRGGFFQVDFAWPEHKVFLEFDGRIKYQELLKEGESPTDAVIREKKREETICRITGWRCIRITWADLYRPEHTAQLIRELLFNLAPSAS